MSDASPATSSTRQVAYLAGPMRGIHEYNFPAFYAAAAALRKHGLDVWSPAENDVNQDGFDPAKDTAHPMRHYMKRDLPAVLNADMVCVLPGWEKSQGAQLEVHVARACGIPVYNAHDMSSVPSAIRSIEVAGVEIKTVTVPLETAKLVRKVCLPHNPNKCRGWHPDALSAVRTFIAAVEAADGK